MPKYKESILQKDYSACYLCGKSGWLECHHIFGKYQRKLSSEQGFTVFLCHDCHNERPNGVHFNREVDRRLKAECQRKYLETHTMDEWMSLVGRNYIETENLTEAK
jgi:hypothetical protein